MSALFDIFKRKDDKKKAETEPAEEKVVKKVEKKVGKVKKVEGSFPYSVIDHQHVTEKASDLMALDKYTFKVFKNANKDMVKNAIEKLYGVKVKSVNVINVPSKSMRLGRIEGTKGGYKKAIVTLHKGQKIEIAPH